MSTPHTDRNSDHTPRSTQTRRRRTRHSSRLRMTGCAALVLGLGLTTAACTGNSDAAEPTPEATTSSTEAPTPAPTPTPDAEPAWMDNYTPDEIRLYDQALIRLERYEQLAEPIFAAGKATPETEDFFRDWWSGSYIVPQGLLETLDLAKATMSGSVTVLDSKATRIVSDSESESVTIRQCIDNATVTVIQNGEEAPGKVEGPRLREIALSRLTGDPFTIDLIESLGKSCKS